ncbi:MAG: amidohydrolase family protein [Cyclobacteriaceae bacterium]
MKQLLFLLLVGVLSPTFAQQVDLLIKNGKVIDGTGNSWFYADVAVKDGRIIRVGKDLDNPATNTIDANGKYVAPGFIDVHAHIEGDEYDVPTADNFIFDGVTSVITGNCGGSNIDINAYYNRLDSIGMSINVGSLVGHNTVRREVMGDAQRDPTVEEQQAMEDLVVRAMKAGAVGLSTGLIYVPGTYSKTAEVVGLAKAAAQSNGVYASHIRSEGDRVTEAIEEAVNIGRQASMPVEISHFKVTYKPNWGRSVSTIAQVEEARRQGVDVTVDQYPYVASSTTLDTTVPEWAFSGGRDSLYLRLKDPAVRAKIKKEMLEGLKKKQLKNYSYAVVARYAPDSTYNGKSISEINTMVGKKARASNEAETILDMITSGRVQMVYFSMDEEDLQRIMKYPFSMVASDAGIVEFGRNVPHPRAYGTNARVLGRYVRELKTIHLEEAIRKMTSLPAQKFQLWDRGLVREGMAADLVVFDANEVNDRATFSKPHAYSTGFSHVIVNGQVVVENGKHNGVRSGQVLRGPGWVGQ